MKSQRGYRYYGGRPEPMPEWEWNRFFARVVLGFFAGAVIVVAVAVLSGCADKPKPVNPGKCPPLVEYPAEFVNAFRLQMQAENPDGTRVIPEGSPIAVYVLDQTLLRDQVRACQ